MIANTLGNSSPQENSHSLRGDAHVLPAVGRLSLLSLEEDEELTMEK